MNTARPSSKLPGSGLPILNERSVNNRRAFLPIRRIKESRIVCNHNVNKVDPSDFSSTAMWTGMGRRGVVAWLATVLGTAGSLQIASEAKAIGFKKELKKKKISVEEYSSLGNGLKYYDLALGNGKEVQNGDLVTVHFDCLFRGIDVVSSRSARLLGGNRVVAEPLQFIAGSKLTAGGVRGTAVVDTESGGGLFSGTSGPKPPPALSSAIIGMKPGGKRSVLVPPELGYGDEGEQEIGPGQSFELQIELLTIEKLAANNLD